MLIIDYNHLFFFAGALQDEIYHQNEFYGSLTLQTENHRGVMISAVQPKAYPSIYNAYLIYKHLCFFADVLQDEMCHQNEVYWSSIHTCMKYTCAYIHVHTVCVFFVLCNRLNVLLLLFLCTGKCLPLQLIFFNANKLSIKVFLLPLTIHYSVPITLCL